VSEVLTRRKVLLNVGCGPRGGGRLPACFDAWRQVRVDVDAAVEPDLIADITDLAEIEDDFADALWAAHCLEHLYDHQVSVALQEFRRVVRDDGFVCVIVPDLQTVANYIAADRLHETLYESPAGPVTPHDVFFGYGAAIAGGRESMAHRCGFTPTALIQRFKAQKFAEIVLRRRRNTLELAAVARKAEAQNDEERAALMAALEL
jgi:hypothetical protein